jgi:hypothetical protein
MPKSISVLPSDRWRKLVCRPREKGATTNRRYLELCVLSRMAKELRSGDLCVAGSDAFADYRDYLLPWNECEKRLPGYCEKLGMQDSGSGFRSCGHQQGGRGRRAAYRSHHRSRQCGGTAKGDDQTHAGSQSA